MDAADIVFLCLPDAAAVEAVALAEGRLTCLVEQSEERREGYGREEGACHEGKEL